MASTLAPKGSAGYAVLTLALAAPHMAAPLAAVSPAVRGAVTQWANTEARLERDGLMDTTPFAAGIT